MSITPRPILLEEIYWEEVLVFNILQLCEVHRLQKGGLKAELLQRLDIYRKGKNRETTMFSQMPLTLKNMGRTDCKAIMIADMEVRDKKIIDSPKEKIIDELVKNKLSMQHDI